MCTHGCPCPIFNGNTTIIASGMLGFVLQSSFLLYQRRDRIFLFTAIAAPAAVASLAGFWLLLYPNLHMWGIYASPYLLIAISALASVIAASTLAVIALRILRRK